MKNLFLIFTCLFFTIALAAQSHVKKPGFCVNEKDRNVQHLASQINTIAYSNMHPDQKEARIMGIMGSYLSKYKSVTTKYPTTNPGWDKAKGADVNTTKLRGKEFYKDCDPKRVRMFLEDFRQNQFLHIPAKYLAQLGNVKTDCALAKAVEIYNNVGYENLSSANICEIIGCNTDEMRSAPKSRGAGLWQYTGVKRFFTEEDDFGWRYLCEFVIPTDDRATQGEEDGLTNSSILDDRIRMMENEDPTKNPSSKGDTKGEDIKVPGLDTNNAQWRTEETVDRW